MSSLIYNVTIKIDHKAKTKWLTWMKEQHIPDVMATACFKSFRVCKLEGHDDDDGETYAVQYDCPSQELLNIYQAEHAPGLQEDHQNKFNGLYVAFRSILKVLEEG